MIYYTHNGWYPVLYSTPRYDITCHLTAPTTQRQSVVVLLTSYRSVNYNLVVRSLIIKDVKR